MKPLKRKSFRIGDIVRVAEKLPREIQFFPGGGELAMVVELSCRDIGDYAYGLRFRKHEFVAWYPHRVLSLVA